MGISHEPSRPRAYEIGISHERQRRRFCHSPFAIRHSPTLRSATLGFTLLELLVVVAVLALLLAILLPSLHAARRQAKIVACQSNLKQLAIGWHQYLDAHGGAFPKGIALYMDYGGHDTSISPGPKLLNKYVGLPPLIRQGGEVFRCPADDGSEDVRPSHFVRYGTSYETNRFLIGQTSFKVFGSDPCRDEMIEVRDRIASLKRDAVAHPDRLILMGEFHWWDEWHYRGTHSTNWHRPPFHHNVAFLDGHARFVHIRKGLSVTSQYTVVPFRNLLPAFSECQQEVVP